MEEARRGRKQGRAQHALLIEDGNHARRERVVRDLRDLQELVTVY
jgi:hypothetical protein